MSTPSERLTARIAERLAAEGLIARQDAARLIPRIAEGKMRPEDWRLVVERARMAARRHE